MDNRISLFVFIEFNDGKIFQYKVRQREDETTGGMVDRAISDHFSDMLEMRKADQLEASAPYDDFREIKQIKVFPDNVTEIE